MMIRADGGFKVYKILLVKPIIISLFNSLCLLEVSSPLEEFQEGEI